MATKTVLVCDLCEGEPAQSYEVSLDGQSFTAELCDSCRSRLTGSSPPPSARTLQAVKPADVSMDPKVIRAWAAENGIEVNPKGRIPSDVLMAYRREHR